MNRGRMILYSSLIAGTALIIIGLLYNFNILSLPYIKPMDLIVVGISIYFGPYGIYYNRLSRRISSIEERLPDFLRDVAEAGRFGMTLSESIIVASSGRYGPLTKEIKKMAAQIEWGVPVNEALENFKERIKTPLVERMITIIIKANEAGGNVADVLNMVSHAAMEAQNVEKERVIEMQTYVFVMFIAFGVFLATILILAASFFPEMYMAGSALAGVSSVGGTPISVQYKLIPEVEFLFVVATLINAVGDGILAGVLSKGKYEAGFFLAFVMLLAGYIFLRVMGIV
ncbi:MAG TPA: type II secretion system F family protein [Euryarchaeota archaeon]|nr:type II secretion system F family protein [Euryarchaeota archaeon]